MCSILTQNNLFISLQICLIQILYVFLRELYSKNVICLLFPVDIDQIALNSVHFSKIFSVLPLALHQFVFSQVSSYLILSLATSLAFISIETKGNKKVKRGKKYQGTNWV